MDPKFRVDPSEKAFPGVKHKRSFNSNGGGSACDKEKAPLTDNSIFYAWRCVLIQREKPSSALCCWLGYCTRVDERVMLEIPFVPWLAKQPEPNRELFPDHLSFILHHVLLVGAGSLWPSNQ